MQTERIVLVAALGLALVAVVIFITETLALKAALLEIRNLPERTPEEAHGPE